MKIYTRESNIKPSEWQFELSAVYHNTNVAEIIKEGPVEEKVFTYDTEEYTLEEYNLLANKKNSDAIDDILVAMLGE